MAKRATGKSTGAKSKAGKKAAKKSARKSAGVKKNAVKKSAARKAKRKLANKKSGAKKSAAKKTAARKPAKKSARKSTKKSVARKTASKKSAARKIAPKKPRAGNRIVSKLNAPAQKPPARKPLATASGASKTARSRLAKRTGHEAVLPARKMELRTSVSRGAAPPARQRRPSEVRGAFEFEAAMLGFRSAGKQDWPGIRRLLVESFGRAEESELVERLRASGDLASEFIAEHESGIVAFLAFSKLDAAIDDRPIRAACLAPLAVAAEVERKGVGTRLVMMGLESIRGDGYTGVFVLGDPLFYERFGFSAQLAARFVSKWNGENFQALEFELGGLEGSAGWIEWPEPFGQL